MTLLCRSHLDIWAVEYEAQIERRLTVPAESCCYKRLLESTDEQLMSGYLAPPEIAAEEYPMLRHIYRSVRAVAERGYMG